MIGKIVSWFIPDITTLEFLAFCIFGFAFGINTGQINIALWALGFLVGWFIIRFCSDNVAPKLREWRKKWPDRPECSKY